MWNRCSVRMHRSITTTIPAARAFAAAASFTIPVCIQITVAFPARIASSTIGSTWSEGRKMFTISYGSGTAERFGYALSPRISVAVGFTGMSRYPWACMYAGTVCASLLGSREHPTTPIVRYLVRISFVDISVVETADDDHATAGLNPAGVLRAATSEAYLVTVLASTRDAQWVPPGINAGGGNRRGEFPKDACYWLRDELTP